MRPASAGRSGWRRNVNGIDELGAGGCTKPAR
jgi:hypothetical protein